MKTYPILFSTEMVQAILDGTKTQTRRVVKPQPADSFLNNGHVIAFVTEKTLNHTVYCPYGEVGDVLWVREMFCPTGSNEYLNDSTGLPFFYKADVKDLATEKEVMNHYGWKYKPSIHMPKEACRIFLKITNIRVERLHDIDEEDAELEGVKRVFTPLFQEYRYRDYLDASSQWRSAKYSFESLWISINGAESWEANPWVWVIEFERTVKPENF